MSHFQIYIPQDRIGDGSGQGPDALAAAGLADLATDFDALHLPSGPDGGSGMLYAWRTPADNQMGYDADAQLWIPQAAAQPGYWVGVWNQRPPREAELARRYRHRGRSMPLGNGESWLIPRATDLPTSIMLADDGSLKFEVHRQFHEFVLEAEQWRELVESIDPDDSHGNVVAWQRLWEFALRALRINYRITAELVSHLRLFDKQGPSSVTTLMYCVIGALDALDDDAGAMS